MTEEISFLKIKENEAYYRELFGTIKENFHVLFCGSRDFYDNKPIFYILSLLPAAAIVGQGEATGADKLAKDCAQYKGFDVIGYPANWTAFGRYAGPKRNRFMLEHFNPAFVFAFFSSKVRSKGTSNMIHIAREANKLIYVYEPL